MKAVPITETVIRLNLYGVVNAYLVREDDGFTLVDTVLPKHGVDLTQAAHAAGGPIRRIALTHGHGDHVGSLDELHDTLGPDVPVLMGELDARIHAGEKVTDRKPTGSWPALRTTPDERLKGGDRVGSLEVVDSPGHSPGHVAFLEPRTRVLIAGDVFSTLGGLAVASYPHWRFPLPGFVTFDKPQNLRSARALRALDPEVLVVGHGREVRAPGVALDAAIARAQRRAGLGGPLMARVGLDAALVVHTAAEIADAEGLERVTLAAVAQRLGVRSPSLYAHVGGLADLRVRVAVDACHDLREALAGAALGRSGGEALRAVADAYRAWAHAHPGRYATIAHDFGADPAAIAAAAGVAEIVFAVMRSYGLEGEDAVHGARAVRAAIHGFITLEQQGGFRMAADPEQTWQRILTMLDRGLRATGG